MTFAVGGLPLTRRGASSLLGYVPEGGVLLNASTLELVEFDAIGMDFWRALRESRSLKTAAESLAGELGADPDALEADLGLFLSQLRELGLVEQADGQHLMGGTVTALIACHNRRDVTVACVKALFAAIPAGWTVSAVMVDDGSTDGTAEAVADLGLDVTIVRGPGSWFWSRSMAQAELVAEKHDPDALLWLNDDVILDPSALRRALSLHQQSPDVILAGAMWSPEAADVSFTGFRIDDQPPVRMRRVIPGPQAIEIDSFHGNFVLVPRAVRRVLGPIDGSWPHQFADLDYAARAQEAGIGMRLLPGLVGQCTAESAQWLDLGRSPVQRLAIVLGRKGWPPISSVRFTLRHRNHARAWNLRSLYTSALTGSAGRQPPRPRRLRVRVSDAQVPTELLGSELPACWRPVPAADLMRLGPARDGGYVVSHASVHTAQEVITGGLGNDWAFEQAFRDQRPIPVSVYDGTMGAEFWAALSWRQLLALRRSGRMPTYPQYRRFFNQPDVTHIDRNLGTVGLHVTSMAQALAETGDRQIFIKLDIEGGEYVCLGDLVHERERITGLVIEMHEVGFHQSAISSFIRRLDTHILTFVRTNNAGGTDERGRPRILEMSWVRADLFSASDIHVSPSLIYCNDPLRQPLPIRFAEA